MHAECVTFVRILRSMIEVIQQEFIVNKINKGLGNWIRLGFVVRNRCLCVCIKLFIFETTCIVPSGPATGLQGSAINSTAIQLSWQPPPSDELNGVLELYTVTLIEIPSGVMITYNTTLSIWHYNWLSGTMLQLYLGCDPFYCWLWSCFNNIICDNSSRSEWYVCSLTWEYNSTVDLSLAML